MEKALQGMKKEKEALEKNKPSILEELVLTARITSLGLAVKLGNYIWGKALV